MRNKIYLYRFSVIIAALILLLSGSIAVPSYLNTITPSGIVVHHSAVPFPGNNAPLDVSVIDEIHRRRGFSIFYWGRFYHVGYHYLILPDGTVQSGRPEHCQGAHATGYNSFIGICLIGDFSEQNTPPGAHGPTEPTPAQMQALLELVGRLRKQYGITVDQIIEHRSVNQNTECPGDRFSFTQFIERLRTQTLLP